MADKSSGKKDREIRLSEAQLRHPGMEHAVRPRGEAADSPASQRSDLAQEYRYVLADLRRIGAIAVVMVGVLVGLALFLA